MLGMVCARCVNVPTVGFKEGIVALTSSRATLVASAGALSFLSVLGGGYVHSQYFSSGCYSAVVGDFAVIGMVFFLAVSGVGLLAHRLTGLDDEAIDILVRLEEGRVLRGERL